MFIGRGPIEYINTVKAMDSYEQEFSARAIEVFASCNQSWILRLVSVSKKISDPEVSQNKELSNSLFKTS